ncbi:hypothetical protein BAE44_0022686 [Dichanthelium oligosanthes]|uniref:RING-type domain-containing protein n=1 Tax=Dichanthelium oligosanthes TaxID=888268 RepID=A0A1E5UU21_9POAL|nr:hypothetical protein BAE44_0022686 [Dichanthelium oligosanthes]
MARGVTGDAAGSSAAAAAERGSGAAAPAPVPTWQRVRRAGQGAVAHALLLCFTALLALKLDGVLSLSWWVLFIPLWLFHAVAARCRFSLPAPSSPESSQRVPCHSIVATPLLVAFELLLCVYLEGLNGHGEPFIDLKLVFLPLLALEIITLVDNFRMCGALMPGHGETITDEAIWERLPDFPVLCFYGMHKMVKSNGSLILSMTDLLFVICSYSTFCSYPPEVVKEMPKKVLVKEVQRLQLALEEQTEMANHSQQQCDRLKNVRLLSPFLSHQLFAILMNGSCVEFALKETSALFSFPAAIMFSAILHYPPCRPCSNKCHSCPICRLTIESRLFVYDAVMIHYVTQFRSSHVGSSSGVPTSGVGKDGPQ